MTMRILGSIFLICFLNCLGGATCEPEQTVTPNELAEDSTALTQAIIQNDAERVGFLLRKGTDLNKPVDMELVSTYLADRFEKQIETIEDFVGFPIFQDVTTPLMLSATLHGKNNTILVLLEAGANPNAIDGVGRSALILNSLYNGSESVAQALLEHGADVDSAMKNGITPLFGACSRAQPVELIQLLLEKGSNPNASMNNGFTPLMEAAKNYHDPQVINLLLNYEADIHAESFKGNSAFSQACAWNTSIEVIDQLYLAGGDENHRLNDLGYGRTPIMSAAIDSTSEVVQYLISIGADVNLADDRGDTALMLAAKWNTPEVVILLLKAGAVLEARDRDGATPLLLACKYNNSRMVRSLLDAEAELRATDYDGAGAIEYANTWNLKENAEQIVKLIEAIAQIP